MQNNRYEYIGNIVSRRIHHVNTDISRAVIRTEHNSLARQNLECTESRRHMVALELKTHLCCPGHLPNHSNREATVNIGRYISGRATSRFLLPVFELDKGFLLLVRPS